MTIVALLCAIAFQANAQKTPEEALKDAEKLAKQADKHPKDGKLQYKAGIAFYMDELGDKKDAERAFTYLDRALKIATENPAPKDTLMGLTCMSLSIYYMQKQEFDKCYDYIERAIDAFEYELGRQDPVTNGTKFIYANFMLGAQPFRAIPKILESFYDNSVSPQDKRITNMDEANIAEEVTLEFLISQYTQRYRYALPSVHYKGKPYIVVQTADWNCEKPLVGWMVPQMMRTQEEREAHKGDDLILCDDKFNYVVLKDDDEDKPKLTYNFKHFINNPKQLESNPEEARIIFFYNHDQYNNILAKYREFKAKKE